MNNPAPRTGVVRHRNEEVRRGADERAARPGDEHTGSRVGEHGLERSVQRVLVPRMTQLTEAASELGGVHAPCRANGCLGARVGRSLERVAHDAGL